MNVVHSVEKIEKILMADPKSQDVAIFMSDERYPVTLCIDLYRVSAKSGKSGNSSEIRESFLEQQIEEKVSIFR